MQVDNPIEGQRCIHTHATLDTSLLMKGATESFKGNVEHLSNMMVFHNPATNTQLKHTSFSARRHTSGTRLKAVVNLKDVKADELNNLKFLGVTRDHMLDADSALRHPSSAGMFAVCIDGVVTVRAPCDDKNDLIPGDFLYVDIDPIKTVDEAKTERMPLSNTNGDICTFRLKKARTTVSGDRFVKDEARCQYDTYNHHPIGRLVELRELGSDMSEYRISLCPFGPPYAMLDSGVSANDLDPGTTKKFDEVDNGPFKCFALTWLDYELIQPRREQAQQPSTQSIIGTVFQQSDLGANQRAVEAETDPVTMPEDAMSLDEWKGSVHAKGLSEDAHSLIGQAATASRRETSIFINSGGDARVIQDATDFKKNVLKHVDTQHNIQQGTSTVSIYSAGRKRAAPQTTNSSKKQRARK